jgi:antibiotic biosynthesis monooxygenase (ABM) superfamily enzyme
MTTTQTQLNATTRRDDEHVTILWSRRVRGGREAEFETWAHGITAAARTFPGHLSTSVLNVPGTSDYHVLYTFADRPSLDTWLDSDQRASWMAQVERMTEEERPVQRVTGLETWFTLPRPGVATMKPPPRWKMWLVTVAAIYPLILALFSLLTPVIAEWPLPLRALAFPIVLVTLMTYVVMPTLTRALHRWLSPGPSQ